MRAEETAVNPMDGLGNLADAMLVLAVGIMLALVLNWKLDLTTVTAEPEATEAPIEISEDDMQSTSEDLDADALQKVGALYYDEATGTYYAITGEP
jgi:hypothetical protein